MHKADDNEYSSLIQLANNSPSGAINVPPQKGKVVWLSSDKYFLKNGK